MTRVGAPAPSDSGRSRDVLRSLRHELRTPINHILGFTDLLLDEADTTDDRDWTADLGHIREAGRQVLALVDDIVAAQREGTDLPDAAVVSRELRTALTAIIGYSDLLQEEAPERGKAAAMPDLTKIHAAATRLLALVNAALELDTGPDHSGAKSDEAGVRSDQATPTPAPEPSARGGPDGAVPQPPGTILVADDDAQNRELLSRRLIRLGHTVIAAGDGREALALVRSHPIDLLLLDVMMPDLDGFAVLAQLKSNPSLRELPVIVLSALDEVATAVSCIELGANDYLTKPFDPVLLQARINACLEKKRLRDRELDYLRQAARVTGPAVIGQLLVEGSRPALETGRGPRGARGEGSPSTTSLSDEAALLAELAELAEPVRVNKGETLFQAGDRGDRFFVVTSGRLQIVDPTEPERSRNVGEVRSGDTLGELEMLTGKPRAVTVIALRDATLASISQESFDHLADTFPRVLTRTTRDVVERLREAFQRRSLARAVTAVALVPLTPDVPLRDLVTQLRAALSPFGSTLHLNPGQLPDLLGHDAASRLQDDNASDRLAAWLNELEIQYRFVLYEADPATPAWTSRCLRQADRVILVSNGHATSSIPIADLLARLPPATPVDLALVHEGTSTRPRGTSGWLGRWPITMHHHLRKQNAEDVARLARLVAGRGVALVLSGGGARGWAHVGVIRALNEAKIPIDLIGGTSMGALIASYWALGLSYQEIIEIARTYSPPRALFDYTLPVVSLFTGRKVLSMLETVFGDTQIEDLWRPFFCVSSSLTRAQPVVHRRGPLWQAVRASISLAGIWPPVVLNGDLLIDGAYLNNLPIDVMRDWSGHGTIVAVNTNPAHEPLAAEIGPSVSGWRVMWRKLVPWGPPAKAPSIAATILRASSLNGTRQLAVQQQLADLTINPPVAQFGILDFTAFQDVIDIGYETARRQLAVWQRERI